MTRRTRGFLTLAVIVLLSLLYLRAGLVRRGQVSFDGLGPYRRPRPRPGSFDWASRQEDYPIEELRPLPSPSPDVTIPRIQADFGQESSQQRYVRRARQQAVLESFRHSWRGYKRHAWLQDEVSPIAGGGHRSFGWATTMIDSLDTLWIMGERGEFEEAVDALRASVNLTAVEAESRSVFETTIRHFGGLLAAYDLSRGRYPALLDMAVELGDMLYAAFDTPNRMPVNWWRWQDAVEHRRQTAKAGTSLAELGSLTLEFTRLSQLTQDGKFYDAVQRIADELERAQERTQLPGLWPISTNAATLSFGVDHRFTLGALADSTYEYLPKQYLLLGGASRQPRDMYERSIEVIKDRLLFRPMLPDQRDILISGSVQADRGSGRVTLEAEAQHLACFVGGMVGLAAQIFERPQDRDTARRLVDGCVWAYEAMPSGIMPESFQLLPCPDAADCGWDEDRWRAAKRPEVSSPPGVTAYRDRRYILRPEAIESVFYQYRITGNASYQDVAWKMFEAIEKHTRTDIAASSLDDVTTERPGKTDQMESFWLGETLKYFYLIFSEPDVISLDEYVLNTEAHPFRRPA